jgi:hypothetical protein
MPSKRTKPVVAGLVAKELNGAGASGLSRYHAALTEACAAAPPPYGQAWYGDRYRSWAVDPSWMAQSLIDNAAKEGEGAQKLWALAGRSRNSTIAEAVRRHAIDEARHARFYIALLQLAFPSLLDRRAFGKLQKLSPGYTTKDFPSRLRAANDDSVLDEIVQMNIGEIRTLIHQKLMRPVLTMHCPPDGRPRLTKLLDGLGGDELKHIEYTARLIDEAARSKSEFVNSTFRKRVAEFNRITLNEVGAGTYD